MIAGTQTVARSFGGGTLAGSKIVRIAYMDEAGISRASQEPIVVVAAAIINPDRLYHDVRKYYRDLADDLFPDGSGRGMIFHASDVFHGSGQFPRSKWSRPERMKILDRLAQVPSIFNIPLCIGATDKHKYIEMRKARTLNISEKECLKWSHIIAFSLALQSIDHWMLTRAHGEVAMLIAEDTPNVKERIRYIHGGAQTDAEAPDDIFTTQHIVEEINFVEKSGSDLLQIADTVAFLSKRVFNDCAWSRPLLARFKEQIVIPPKSKKIGFLNIPASRLRRVEI